MPRAVQKRQPPRPKELSFKSSANYSDSELDRLVDLLLPRILSRLERSSSRSKESRRDREQPKQEEDWLDRGLELAKEWGPTLLQYLPELAAML
jgi:hypothetical protein